MGTGKRNFSGSKNLTATCSFMGPEIRGDASGYITIEEIRRATYTFGGYKAPMKDGIQALFYQSQWHLVGAKLGDLVQ
ncbi:unnamed protein product [Lupinus luteus]|uniref:Uncharacterized protein n=1 Tax=Lupinus luteus TaxID=3873 RepID=A0AAV1Y3F7_LUPLU